MVHAQKVIIFSVLSAYIVAWSVFGDNAGLELTVSSPWWTRITYQLCHDGFLHAGLNSYCMMMMVCRWRLRYAEFIAAMAIAALIPDFILSERAVVGMSGALFAVFGMRAVYAESIVRYNLQVALVIALGFFFSNCAAWLHMYAYVAGVMFASINRPIEWNDMNR